MTEMTIALPLSGEEIVEAIKYRLGAEFFGDCHLNPALAYPSFKNHLAGVLTLYDNGREVEIPYELDMVEQPPNVVRQQTGQPIPTLVEDSSGKKEVKNVKYNRMSAQSGPGGTQHDPGKQQPNPHPPGTPEHEKHEKERKEREEKEKKQEKDRR